MSASSDQLKIFEQLRMQTMMRALRRLLALPNRLYHYTTSDGLLGILHEGRLRATNYAYLNDSVEMEYGRAAVHEELAATMRAATDKFRREALELLGRHFDDAAPSAETFLTCFCEDGDLLSQWRGYGDNSGRYCLEFESRHLWMPGQGFSFANVLYDRVAQGRVIAEGADLIVDALRQIVDSDELDADSPAVAAIAAFGVGYLAERAAFFKAHAFREEKEWRAVGHLLPGYELQSVDFAVSGVLIRPHTYLISGQAEGAKTAKLPITKIIVGATRYPREAVKSVQLLSAKYGYVKVGVELSDVTLRA